MRWLFLLAVCALPWALCSCRTGTTVSGDPCYELSKEELDELVAFARRSLQNPGRQLTPAESRTIMTAQPKITVLYNGDCSGEARIRWDFPDKYAGIIYQGLLNDFQRRIMIFEIIPKNDRTVYKGVPGRKDTAR